MLKAYIGRQRAAVGARNDVQCSEGLSWPTSCKEVARRLVQVHPRRDKERRGWCEVQGEQAPRGGVRHKVCDEVDPQGADDPSEGCEDDL